MINQNVKKYLGKLRELRIKYEILEHPELKTVPEVMGYLKLPVSQALATLIMKADEEFVAIVKKGDEKVDSEKIRKVLGVRSLRLVNKEEYGKIIEAPLGAAFVYNPGLKTLIDSRVFGKEFMVGGSGSFECSIRYCTEDLKKIPNSRVVDVIDFNGAINMKKRVFSGLRPTNFVHIGNYLGAIKGQIELQNKPEFDCIYSVVDLHGITTPFKPSELQNQIKNLALDLLGCGLDPQKCHLMVQSQVPEHTELAYLLGTIFPVARLEDLPTYKDKKAENPDYVNMGLLYYPVLMAADIMIYKADTVPVGKDQVPHIEITREFARIFNRMFGKTFPEPQAYLMEGAYVPSLKGEGKMSKSVEGSYILLTDNLEMIRNRLAGAPTDTGKGAEVPQTGGVANLLTLIELFEGKDARMKYESQYLHEGIRYQDLKHDLANAIYEQLKPIQEKRRFYEQNPKLVDEILEEGREYCSQIAKETLKEVKEKMGLV